MRYHAMVLFGLGLFGYGMWGMAPHLEAQATQRPTGNAAAGAPDEAGTEPRTPFIKSLWEVLIKIDVDQAKDNEEEGIGPESRKSAKDALENVKQDVLRADELLIRIKEENKAALKRAKPLTRDFVDPRPAPKKEEADTEAPKKEEADADAQAATEEARPESRDAPAKESPAADAESSLETPKAKPARARQQELRPRFRIRNAV